jgi:hypothetical protein
MDFGIICYLELTVNKPLGEKDFGRTTTTTTTTIIIIIIIIMTNKMDAS